MNDAKCLAGFSYHSQVLSRCPDAGVCSGAMVCSSVMMCSGMCSGYYYLFRVLWCGRMFPEDRFQLNSVVVL